jgi:hypothetical protein
MGEKDLRLLAIFGLRVHGCTVHRVATWRVPAVGPIQRPMNRIEVQIDRPGKIVIKKLNVPAALGRLTLWRHLGRIRRGTPADHMQKAGLAPDLETIRKPSPAIRRVTVVSWVTDVTPVTYAFDWQLRDQLLDSVLRSRISVRAPPVCPFAGFSAVKRLTQPPIIGVLAHLEARE